MRAYKGGAQDSTRELEPIIIHISAGLSAPPHANNNAPGFILKRTFVPSSCTKAQCRERFAVEFCVFSVQLQIQSIKFHKMINYPL
jgi:hypothetical protein